MAFESEGVEIDRCVACGGTWLDAGELEWIAERAGVEPGPLTEAVRAGKSGTERTNLRCPRCRRRMQKITVGGERNVELDRCRRGHGLWFDEGEMGKVIASFVDGEEGAVGRFFCTNQPISSIGYTCAPS